MPSLATTTPVPVAMELPMSGADGLPSEAWMSLSASGSSNGLNAAPGLNGHVRALGPPGRATFLTSGVDAGLAGATRNGTSGMMRATAGLWRRALTSAADSVAATELGTVN